MTDLIAVPAPRDLSQAAEERGRRRGYREAADYLERVAAEWTSTEGGQAVASALRLEARNLRRMHLRDCSASPVER